MSYHHMNAGDSSIPDATRLFTIHTHKKKTIADTKAKQYSREKRKDSLAILIHGN